MQRIINIYRLGIKELRSLWHDKVLLFFVIWVFSGGIYSVATGTSLELHNAPIAIVDEADRRCQNELSMHFTALTSRHPNGSPWQPSIPVWIPGNTRSLSISRRIFNGTCWPAGNRRSRSISMPPA